VNLLAWLPWCIPGILFGLSMLWLILASRALSFLYGSMASLIIIMFVSQMPIGVQMMKTSVRQIAVELEQSSRVCGAGPMRTFLYIVLPVLQPILVKLFLIVLVSALRDISTIIFLAGAQSQTLSLLMMQFATSSNLEA